jgi:hypothetical protein
MPQSTVELSAGDWESFRESAARDSGGMLPLSGAPPELFASLDVTIVVDGQPVATFSGQVVNLFGDHVALVFDDDAKSAIAKSDGCQSESKSTAASGRRPSRHDSPVWKRYAELSRPEKIKLARTGNEAERRAILKDRDSSLHHFVLNNSSMKPKELCALIRGGGVSGAFLKKLCERPDFLNNRAIAEALVINPQTPTDVAVRLVARVPLETARRIARSSTYKPQVVNAAKKRVINR